MEKSKFKDVLIVGFALFAMFFGAGNLILPPYIGIKAGNTWLQSLIGFGLTGIGLPLFGIVAMAKNDGSLERFAGKFSHVFSIILGILIILSIGPLLAIPRTGATTYEIAVRPIYPTCSPMLFSFIFFGLTLYFSINKSTVIDKIGKILTPMLLIMLGIIIIKGIFSPIGNVVSTNLKNSFSASFIEGYQTMDAFASIFFAGIVIDNIKARGYKSVKDQVKLTICSGVVAAIGLFIVYGGLMYLGATASGLVLDDIERTTLLVQLVGNILGDVGKIPLGLAVGLACLTTAVGLTVATGEFFSRISKGKLSYKGVVLATVISSTIISSYGVESIIQFSGPVLITLYPVVIVLIVMNTFKEYIKNGAIYATAVAGAFAVSVFNGLAELGLKIDFFEKIISHIPLADSGFAWVSTALIGFSLGMILFKEKTPANTVTNFRKQ